MCSPTFNHWKGSGKPFSLPGGTNPRPASPGCLAWIYQAVQLAAQRPATSEVPG